MDKLFLLFFCYIFIFISSVAVFDIFNHIVQFPFPLKYYVSSIVTYTSFIFVIVLVTQILKIHTVYLKYYLFFVAVSI